MPIITPAALLWASAGKPLTPDAVAFTGDCWWCGQPASGHGRRVKDAVASTFPDANKASGRPIDEGLDDPDKPVRCVCMACGWTWSDAVRLPQHILSARLLKKLEKGGLVTSAVPAVLYRAWLSILRY